MADFFGTEGHDSINGLGGEDRLFGLGGNDALWGADGFDRLYGGLGDDRYYITDASARYLNGQLIGFFADPISELAGEGIDTVHVNTIIRGDTIFGVGGYELPAEVENGYIYDHVLSEPLDFDLTGNGSANILGGNGARNSLNGMGGNDRLHGGSGRDTLTGGAGNDIFVLEDLSAVRLGDQILGFAYDIVVENAGEGIDRVEVMALDESLQDDYTLPANVENGAVQGFVDFDLTGNDLANSLFGNAGENIITGGLGNDRLDGGLGFDRLVGGAGNDVYILASLNDPLTPNARYDTVAEGTARGLDTVIVTAHAPFLSGGKWYQLSANVENATITGTSDLGLFGNGLANRIAGNSGANRIQSGGGNDTLFGGNGNDWFTAGGGNDLLRGQGGSDTFHFDVQLNAATNVDRVIGFVSADDQMLLDARAFSGLGAAGPIGTDAFRLGTAAADVSDRVIYNSATGAIFYDRDGVGGAAQILFARVDPGTVLTAADFELFAG